MPLCRIQNPVPYLRTEETLGGGDLVQQRHHVFTFATTNTPISPHTSCGEILAIVDSGTSKHILQYFFGRPRHTAERSRT